MPYILLPQIEGAALTPNPAEAIGAAVLVVTVAERTVWVEPPVGFAGEMFALEPQAEA